MTNKPTPDELELQIEETIGKLYWQLFQLRQLKEYQREYDIMGTLCIMLNQDRQVIREKYKEEISI